MTDLSAILQDDVFAPNWYQYRQYLKPYFLPKLLNAYRPFITEYVGTRESKQGGKIQERTREANKGIKDENEVS